MVTIEKSYKIRFGPKSWSVPPEDTVEIEGSTFVKLGRSARGFAPLVFHENQNLPDPLPAGYSLTASVGYNELVKLRSDAATAHKMNSSGISPLFQNAQKKNSQKLTRKDITDSRGKPIVVNLYIPDADPIQCLASACAQDSLQVSLSDGTIHDVILYLRNRPWDSSLMREKGEKDCVMKKVSRKSKVQFFQREGRRLKRLKSEQSAASAAPSGEALNAVDLGDEIEVNEGDRSCDVNGSHSDDNE